VARTISIDDRLSGTSIWLALGIVGGWLISRFSRRRQSSLSVISEKADNQLKPIRTDRVKVPERGPGILSLGFELLGAVALSLAQRYAKSWSAGLVAQIKGAADMPTVPRALTDTGTSILARAGSGAAGSAYGAASSLITLLLWIYYSSQILLFGAEFTQGC
jgi:hypothetical protein